MSKPKTTLMRCMKCGNVNRSDEIGCVFGCNLGRLNIEHPSYPDSKKSKITEREKECVKIGVDVALKAREKKCENCKWWKASKTTHWGRCKRYAPKPFICSAGANAEEWEAYRYVKWPDTSSSDWCGEFEVKS